MRKVLATFCLAALLFGLLAGGALADGNAVAQRGESHPVWVWAYKSGCGAGDGAATYPGASGYAAVAQGFNVWATTGNAWYLFWAYTGHGGRDWAGFYRYCQYYVTLPTARLMYEPWVATVTLDWATVR
jgi:hypothetical protein